MSQWTVFYVHPEHWVTPSPGCNFITATAHGLAAAGASTHLIVKNKSSEETAALLKSYFGLEPLPNLFIHRIPFANGNRAFHREAKALIRQHRSENTVVITRNPKCVPSLSSIDGCALYYEPHNHYLAPWSRNDLGLRKYWKHFLIERFFLKKASGFIFMNPELKELFLKQHPLIPWVLAPSGVDFTPSSLNQRNFSEIAYVGSILPYKGLDDALKVLRLLPQNFSLKVIGGESSEKIRDLYTLAKTMGIEKKLNVTGWVDSKRLRKELSTSFLGLLPLKDTFFNRHLTLPLKLTDFYGQGIPCLAPNLPSLSGFFASGIHGLQVDWNDHGAVADTIVKLSENRQRYEELVEALQGDVKLRTWKTRGLKILSLTEFH